MFDIVNNMKGIKRSATSRLKDGIKKKFDGARVLKTLNQAKIKLPESTAKKVFRKKAVQPPAEGEFEAKEAEGKDALAR